MRSIADHDRDPAVGLGWVVRHSGATPTMGSSPSYAGDTDVSRGAEHGQLEHARVASTASLSTAATAQTGGQQLSHGQGR